MKENQIIVFDTETTGIPIWQKPSGHKDQPHLVQLAAHQVDLPNRKILQSMDVIIRPDGWTIPKECTDVHGITTEHAKAVGIPEEQAVRMFLNLWDGRKHTAIADVNACLSIYFAILDEQAEEELEEVTA